MSETSEMTTVAERPEPPRWRPDDWLTTEQAAQYLGFSASFLHKARTAGTGPKCRMLASNKAQYQRRSLDIWREERERMFSPSSLPLRRRRRRVR